MLSFRALASAGLVAMCALSATNARAQSAAALIDIQRQLVSLYPPAKATADGTDIVTAGAVLVLQKDHLLMCKVDQMVPTLNVYKNGAITQGGLGGLLHALDRLGRLGGQGASPNEVTREFVTGEKFWVTAITTRPGGVRLSLMSDPINDQRYKATLEFPFERGAIPTADDLASLVSEVVKVDAQDAPTSQSAGDAGGSNGGAQATQEASPPVATKTIAIGQTRDQVIATFGVPTKVVKLGSKEIDVFQDMKVTFVQDKVTNVQ